MTSSYVALKPSLGVIGAGATVGAGCFALAFYCEITALYGSGDYLINEGTYRMRYGPANTTETGNYVNVWKKEADDWKIVGLTRPEKK